jgi:hypothetical protein
LVFMPPLYRWEPTMQGFILRVGYLFFRLCHAIA